VTPALPAEPASAHVGVFANSAGRTRTWPADQSKANRCVDFSKAFTYYDTTNCPAAAKVYFLWPFFDDEDTVVNHTYTFR
jgi:hypothetical protein